MRILSLLLLLLSWNTVFAQEGGTLKGRVFNSINNEALPFVSIVLQGTTYGTTSDAEGNFQLKGIKPGEYNVEASFVGFKKRVYPEVRVEGAKPAQLEIALEEEATTLQEVEVQQSAFQQSAESPLSLRTIGIAEIQRNPGGNRDISNALQSLPGVATSTSFRNDIIIRGGSPNENRFYLDGVEVPNINHFATQGASGGPVGMINVNFIREVDFRAGAFPVNRGNALSSVIEFRQKEGRDDRLGLTGMVSSTDVGLTAEGPVSKNSSFIFSVRRSYLQLLFKALQLPFLPTFNDTQLKYRWRISPKDQLTIIGLGAIDQFRLNLEANETEEQRYTLGYLPDNSQWSYTAGARYDHYRDKSFQTLVVSRSQLYNTATKYAGNDRSSADNLIGDYRSQEIENKIRLENEQNSGNWKLNYGAGYEYAVYTNSTYNKLSTPQGLLTVDYSSRLTLHKGALFGAISRPFFGSRLTVSAGLRTDVNSYSEKMRNPLRQASPRLSASYALRPKWTLNANVGKYYQLPAYTVLGYRNTAGELVNKTNGLRYIGVRHLVGGVAYTTEQNGRFSAEAFHKQYGQYPFLLRDSISLANLGGDFGVIGDAPVVSSSEGRAYGLELLFQQKLLKGFYGILAYTFVRSEFTDRNGNYVPSSWDSRHILSATGGKQWPRNWETGFRFRYTTGTPYTPYDVERSSLTSVWDITGIGQREYTRLNTLRNPVFYQLDVRIDKKYYFNKWSLNFYLDIQNVTNKKAEQQPNLTVQRDSANQPLLNPQDPSRYLTKELKNQSGTILPSIGLMITI